MLRQNLSGKDEQIICICCGMVDIWMSILGDERPVDDDKQLKITRKSTLLPSNAKGGQGTNI